MADEQTQPSHLIDDAIREAEQQLEHKLQLLRMSALAEEPRDSAPEQHAGGEAAELRPTGEVPQVQLDEIDAQWSRSPLLDTHDAAARDTAGLQPRPTPRAAAPTWDDAQLRHGQQPGSQPGGFVPTPAHDAPHASAHDTPHAAAHETHRTDPQAGAYDEEFWAQTRTALRQLQRQGEELRAELPGEVLRRVQDEVTGELAGRVSQQVGASVTDHVERVVRDELVTPSAGIRQLQQQLPLYAHRVEQVVGDELESTSATIRQLQEELPHQLDRLARRVETALHGDVAEVEQSVAENVTRMTSHLSDSVAQVERATTTSFDRIERAMRVEFDRVDGALRTQLDRVAGNVAEELAEPTALLRQLQEEMPAQFQRVERVVRDEVAQGTSGLRTLADLDLDLGAVLGEIVDASRVTLDRLSSVTTQLDEERVQQVQDLELVIDSVTSGWEGVYGAVTRLFDRMHSVDDRMAEIERQLAAVGELGKLEGMVEQTLTAVRDQLDQHLGAIHEDLDSLQAAPVVVTVSHPEAHVASPEQKRSSARSVRANKAPEQEPGPSAS